MNHDPFSSVADSLIAPARLAFPIVPDDNLTQNPVPKALYVGTGGDIAVCAVGSQTDVLLRNVPSGTLIPIRIKAVRATGTSAADLVGLI